MGRLTNDWTLSLDNSDDLNQLHQALKYWKEGRSEELSELKIQIETNKNSNIDIKLIKKQLDRFLEFKFNLDSILQIASIKEENGRDMFCESFLNHLQRIKINSIIKIEMSVSNLVELTIIGKKTEHVILSILISQFCRMKEYSIFTD